MIRVAVLGAAGKMGRTVCGAVLDEPGLDLVGAVDPSGPGDALAEVLGRNDTDLRIAGDLDGLEGAEVAVDFTHPDAVMDDIRGCVERGAHAVVGTTGIGPERQDEIRGWLAADGPNVLIAPNFSVGAVLMQRLAEQAAAVFPAVEVIELHHDQKADAPSGTAADTARRIAAARAEAWKGPGSEEARGEEIEGVRVHSVRLPGLVAHQEVLFGGQGQTLSIRHDSTDRSSFMPGVVLAIRKVGDLPGLTVGLDALL